MVIIVECFAQNFSVEKITEYLDFSQSLTIRKYSEYSSISIRDIYLS